VRLSLRSTATGAANGFRLTASDSDGNNADTLGLSVMAFDPPNGATAMQLMQGSTDAKATVNGIAVTSASNAMTGVVDGLTLNLNKVSSTAVNISAVPDTGTVQTAIKTFASAYNALVTYLGSQTKYDPNSKVSGVLQGDSAATNLQERLRAMVGASSGASSSFARLSDIGLEAQRDGTLTVNQTKLDAATGKLADLKKAFANSDVADSANNGFARRYSDLATQALGVDGTVTTRTAGLQKLITKNSDDQTALNTRVDSFQARLVAQYTALDANVSKLNSLSAYVTQQIANWNKTTA
jgi:flagellar hook-associated protein 2